MNTAPTSPLKSDALATVPGTGNPALELSVFLPIQLMLERVTELGRTHSGYPVARPGDFSLIIKEFISLFDRHRRLLEAGHPQTTADFLDIIERLDRTDLRAYGSEATECLILKAKSFIAMRRPAEALALVDDLANRPYRIEGGINQVSEIFEIDLRARLMLGHLDEISSIALNRLIWTHRRLRSRKLNLLTRFAPFAFIAMSQGGATGVRGSMLKAGAAMLVDSTRPGRRSAKRLTANVVKRWCGWMLMALALRIMRLSGYNPAPGQIDATAANPPPLAWTGEGGTDQPAILVSRAMGGLGDITMMTPGLRALRQRYNRKVAFAIPAKFHAAYEGNPDIVLLDSDQFIDLGNYKRWVNLALCPAARYESGVAPRVRKGRVELFARAMGVRRRALDASGWQPVSVLDANQLEEIERIRGIAAERDLPVVGVQMFSRETYRDYPRLTEVIAGLAQEALVVPIHTSSVPLPDHPNIIPVFGKTLKEAIAMVAASDVFLSVDSAFYHTAAAYSMPVVGLFGPTDGRTCSVHHPNAIVLQQRSRLRCVPCWRNEDMQCHISRSMESACLASIEPDEILSAIRSASPKGTSRTAPASIAVPV